MRALLILISVVVLAVVVLGDAGPGVGAQEFLRGDIDGDGRVLPLWDAYYLLDYAFLGGDAPGCMDAADVDNNGVVFALLDAICLLEWGFENGPDLDDPGTEECGEDTGDSAGCDEVPDPCPADEPDLTADADYTLIAGDVSVELDAEVVVCIHLSHDGDSLTGIQFAVCHDDAIVSIEDDEAIVLGEDLEDFDYTFSNATTVSGGWTAGVLMNVLTGATLESSGSDYELYEVTYHGDGAGTSSLEFCETIGTPTLRTRVFTDDAEILPETTHGSIEVVTGDEDYVLGLSDETGFVDQTAEVSVTLDNTGLALEGFQFGVCHGDGVDLEDSSDVEEGEDLDGLDLTFQAVSTFDGGWNVGLVFKVEAGETLEPARGQELYLATYQLQKEGLSLLEFCTDELDPAVITVVADGEDILPVTGAGSILVIEEGGSEFLRGDCDGNGQTFPLLDAIFVLRWQFLEGDEPPCMDAADADDSGQVSGLLDGLYLLDYGFNDADAPPDPGPTICGRDDSDDEIPCLTPPDDCL